MIPIDHRPWLMPATPWVMAQSWRDLLFAHWPVPRVELERLIPSSLAVDTFDGECWISVVPFTMTGVHPRRLPNVPGISTFPELNVRTYVRHGSKPGVFFFSLDAASVTAVAGGRLWYHLPYFLARMSTRRVDGWVEYHSKRVVRHSPSPSFDGRFRPNGPVYSAVPGSLEHWLTERYCLYSVGRNGQPMRAEVHHAPWPLQPAVLDMRVNTMVEAAGLSPAHGEPIIQFAERLDVVVWQPRPVD